MSRPRARVGFSPMRWNGARKMPKRIPLWAMVRIVARPRRAYELVLPCGAMTDKPIRVGFVGAGANSRKHHIPKLKAQPGVELAGVANRSKASGEQVAREFGIARVYADWRELVRAPDIDAVCIGTWPNTHCEITRGVLAEGKHVLCEARMAMNVAEARSMLDAARRAPALVKQLVPAPNTLEVDSTLQKLLADGYVGDVISVDIRANQGQFVDAEQPLHWRQDAALSGLNVMTMGIWYEALMRWLGPARQVTAMTKIAVPRRKDASGAWQDVRVPDHVEILATLGRGLATLGRGLATLGRGLAPLGRDASVHMRFSTVTALAPPSEVWIFGTEGTLRVESDARRLSGGRRGDKSLSEIAIPADQRIGWRVEEEFVNAIRGREQVSRTTFEDGVRYMEFTEAVWKSAAAGQAVEVAEL